MAGKLVHLGAGGKATARGLALLQADVLLAKVQVEVVDVHDVVVATRKVHVAVAPHGHERLRGHVEARLLAHLAHDGRGRRLAGHHAAAGDLPPAGRPSLVEGAPRYEVAPGRVLDDGEHVQHVLALAQERPLARHGATGGPSVLVVDVDLLALGHLPSPMLALCASRVQRSHILAQPRDGLRAAALWRAAPKGRKPGANHGLRGCRDGCGGGWAKLALPPHSASSARGFVTRCCGLTSTASMPGRGARHARLGLLHEPQPGRVRATTPTRASWSSPPPHRDVGPPTAIESHES